MPLAGALGASRRRIVAQLFVEALTLAGVAAALGIGLVSIVFGRLNAALLPLLGPLPFWMNFELSINGVIYILALTLLAAGIVGVAPALKATGVHVHGRLQSLSAGGGSKMQLGRLWTGLIVAQVALTVALLPSTMFYAWHALRFRTGDIGFATPEFLTTQLVLDRASTAPPTAAGEREFRIRYAAVQTELERRLSAESMVFGVTFSMTGPGEERALVLEVEGQTPPIDPVDYNIVEGTKRGHLVRFNRVSLDFFDAFGVPILMGRDFKTGDDSLDTSGTNRSVLVNRTLADRLLAGTNPLGRRIRYVGRSREAAARDVELDRWYEIVGVVADFPTVRTLGVEGVSRVYHAAAPGDVYPARLAVRVRTAEPSAFAETLPRGRGRSCFQWSRRS